MLQYVSIHQITDTYLSTLNEFLLIIKYIKRKRFLLCPSVTFAKPLSRKRLKNLLQKGKISNATIDQIEMLWLIVACPQVSEK